MQPENHNDLDKRLSRLYAASVPESFETGWRADIRREETKQSMNKTNWKPVWRRIVPALCALVLVVGGLWAGMLEDRVQELTAYETAAVAQRSSGSNSSAKTAANYNLMSADKAAYETGVSYDYGVTTYGAAQVSTGRKLVRTADLTIRTDAFDQAVEHVEKTLSELGGYIENLYQYGDLSRRLTLSMRVPSQKLDDFLAGMDGAGRVTDRSESTTDMTVQYSDNQARLDTLYQKRDRLNELLVKAESVSDLIEIESAIADTQYQIDSYETSQRSIDRQVDMSAVSVTLVEEEQAADNPELTLSQRISAGFRASIEWLGDFGRNVIVFAVMAAPVAVPLAVLWIIWRIIRRVRGKSNREE